MKRSLLCACVVFVAGNASRAVAGQFSVVGSNIYDPSGNLFILKGMNVQGSNSWTYTQPRVIAQDASLIVGDWGFNTIRLNCEVLASSMGSWTDTRNNDLTAIVNAYTSRGAVVMFEAHDRTGSYFENNDLTLLNNWYIGLATQFKDNPYVWFNVMNEPGPWSLPDTTKWLNVHQTIIKTIRDLGAHNVIVVDGATFGQDTGANWGTSLLTDQQSAILSAGTNLLSFGGKNYDNIVFSFHAYSEWNAGGTTKMANYIQRVQAKGLALIAGEYGGTNSLTSTQNLLAIADTYNLGRMAWNWQGDANGQGYNLTTGGGGFLINDPIAPSNLSQFGKLVWADTHSTAATPGDIEFGKADRITGVTTVPGTLSLGSTGLLDIQDHTLLIHYTDDPAHPRTSPAEAVKAQLIKGRNVATGGVFDGPWTGTAGITCSRAMNDFITAHNATGSPNTEFNTLGYGDTGKKQLSNGIIQNKMLIDDAGPGFTDANGNGIGSTVFVRYTRVGDATMDGRVGNNDVTVLGLNFDPSYNPNSTDGPKHWYDGDFNYNGVVDNNDVTMLGLQFNPAQPAPYASLVSQFGSSFATAFTQGYETAQVGTASVVPEPGALVLLSVGTLSLFRRRRLRGIAIGEQ